MVADPRPWCPSEMYGELYFGSATTAGTDFPVRIGVLRSAGHVQWNDVGSASASYQIKQLHLDPPCLVSRKPSQSPKKRSKLRGICKISFKTFGSAEMVQISGHRRSGALNTSSRLIWLPTSYGGLFRIKVIFVNFPAP